MPLKTIFNQKYLKMKKNVKVFSDGFYRPSFLRFAVVILLFRRNRFDRLANGILRIGT